MRKSINFSMSVKGSSAIEASYDCDQDIYRQRKDVASIKNELFALVPNQEYWTSFRKIIHGKLSKLEFDKVCDKYLTSYEMRHLHNQLISAILYNAQYTTVPPPGFQIPKQVIQKKKPSKPPPVYSNSEYFSFTIRDIRAIPTTKVLTKRINLLANNKGVGITESAVSVIQQELKRYIKILLMESLRGVGVPMTSKRNLFITVDHISNALKSNPVLSGIVTQKLLAKFCL